MQLTIVSNIVIQREILQSQLDTISHLISLELTTKSKAVTRTSYKYSINQVHVNYLFLQNSIEFTDTHFTSQCNKLTFVSTKYIVRQVKQEVFQQFCSKMSIVTSVRRSNLFQQTSTNKYWTTVSTLQITRTIFIYIRFHVNQHTFTSLIPFTQSYPFLIISPQIRLLTSLRILQSNCHYRRISRTSNIIINTNCSKIITHLEMSIIVQDITFFTVFFNSRSQTRYLATRFQEFCRDIRSRLTISYKTSIYPQVTVLIRSTCYTYLEFLIIKFQYSSRTKPVIFTLYST